MLRSTLLALVLIGAPARAAEPGGQTVRVDPGPNRFDTLTLAARLRESGRLDEAVSVLAGATQDPADRDAAGPALRDLLLAHPPRSAWATAYAAALETEPVGRDRRLRVHALLADARHPDPRVRARAAEGLDALLAADKGDIELRLAVIEAHLRAGRPAQAQAVAKAGGTNARLRTGQVLALIAQGRIDDAIDYDRELVPGACAATRAPVPCAMGLVDAGHPEAALTSLRGALGRRDQRAPGDRAAIFAAIARIEELRGERAAALAAWKEAHRLAPDDVLILDGTALGLVASGQAWAARQLVGPPEGCGAAARCLARTVEAARLATSVDPGAPGAATDAALEAARRLDPLHPTVARSIAHWHISRGRPADALQALAAVWESAAADVNVIATQAWAADVAREPDRAVLAWRRHLSTVQRPADWERALERMAAVHVQQAEADKARGDLGAAVDAYRIAVAADPRRIDRLQGLGGVLWQAGDLPGAERVYRLAWAQRPQDLDSTRGLVALLRLLGQTGEAARVLQLSGVQDEALAELEAALEVDALTADARASLAAGRTGEALARYAALLEMYPGRPGLLHAQADALLIAERPSEAAAAYARAAALSPGDPWLPLGEVRAWIAAGDLIRARARLAAVPATDDAAVQREIAALERALARAEAAAALSAGDAETAIAAYRSLLAEDPADAETAAALGNLYLSRWQAAPARAWFDEALRLDPTRADAARGLVRVELVAGDLDAAEARAAALVAEQPGPAHLALVGEIERRRAIEGAAAAAARGDTLLAERLLLDAEELWPEHPELRVAAADLAFAAGDTAGAWRAVTAVLRAHPTDAAALAAARRMGPPMGRTAEVLALHERAVAAGAPPWIAAEADHLRLQLALDKAVAEAIRGRAAAARIAIEAVQRKSPPRGARALTAYGDAWAAAGDPARAIAAYELALQQEPGAGAAALGLARTLQAQGELAGAEDVLAAQFARTGDAEAGVALAAVQRARGRASAARRTEATLRARATEDGVILSGGPAPAPLPVLLPPGAPPDALAASAADPDAPPTGQPPDTAARGAVALDDPSEDPDRRATLDASAGFGWVTRPGAAGEQFLNAVTAPLVVAVGFSGPLSLEAEAVPVVLDDGLRRAEGTAASVGLRAAGGPGAASLRVGSSPTGFATDPYLVWAANASMGVGGGFSAGLETARAPVTDSLTAWAGAFDAAGRPYGRVVDTHLGGQLGWGGAGGQSLGAIGRVGQSAGLGGMPIVPWWQVLGYGRVPLEDDAGRQLALAAEAIVVDHDVQVDGFGPGQGAFFTPDRFWSAMGKLEAGFQLEPGSRWAACIVGGAGPQQVRGEPTLYLGPGLYLGYTAQAALQAALGGRWSLAAHAAHLGSLGAWGQSWGQLQLRHGAPPAAPSPTVGSGVHGPPLGPFNGCGGDWTGWTP